MTENEKQIRIVRSVIPIETRGQTIKEAIRKYRIAQGKICGTCGEWPEFCVCDEENGKIVENEEC